MRNLTASHKTQLAAKRKRVGVLVEIDYTPTPLRAWSGKGNVTWDGKTWSGVAGFGGMSAIQEKTGIRAGMVKLTLNGVPTDKIETALDNNSQNREVKIYLGTFTESGGVWTIVDAPNCIEWGDTDVHEIVEGDDNFCSIEVSVETPLARLSLLSVLTYTVADQQLDFPGDTGFRFAPQVSEQILYWPNPEPAAAAAPASTAGSGYKPIHAIT